MIINQTEMIENGDKRQLFTQSWSTPSKDNKDNLLILHGLGEHSNAYDELANTIADKVNVFSFDFSGHGRSEGQRGYVGDIDWLIDDLNTVIKRIDKPLNIFAHSLGGLVLTNAIENNSLFKKPKKIILSNPCLGLKVNVPKWKKLGADLLTKSLPRVTLGNEISVNDLSTDTSYIENFSKDPLRHTKISPRLYLGMLDFIESLSPDNFPNDIESLILLSENDPVCDSFKTETYFSNFTNKTIHIFKNSLHEILNDIEKSQAHKLIKDFLC